MPKYVVYVTRECVDNLQRKGSETLEVRADVSIELRWAESKPNSWLQGEGCYLALEGEA